MAEQVEANLGALTQPRSPKQPAPPPAGRADALRAQILELVGEYCKAAFSARPFLPGQSPVPVAGRVFDDREVAPWWTPDSTSG